MRPLVATALITAILAVLLPGLGPEDDAPLAPAVDEEAVEPGPRAGPRADAAPPVADALPPGRLLVSVECSGTGTPVRGAAVSVDGRPAGFTDGAGRARIGGLDPGIVRVTVSAEGFLAEERAAAVHPGDEVTCRFGLARPRPVVGTLIDDETGRPVAGARVTAVTAMAGLPRVTSSWWLGDELGSAETDAGGRFSIGGVAEDADLSLLVVAGGYRTVRRIATRAPPGESEPEFPIRLVRGGAIRGRVTRPDGAPVPGTRVLATLFGGIPDPDRAVPEVPLFYEPLPGDQAELWGVPVATADEAGRYSLAGLGLGETYRLLAAPPGFRPHDLDRTVRLDAAAPEALVDVALPGTDALVRETPPSAPSRRPERPRVYGRETLAGIVTDERGVPLAGHRVHLPGLRRRVRTDEAGRFTALAVPAGRHRVVVDGGRHERVDVAVPVPGDPVGIVAKRHGGVWMTLLPPPAAEPRRRRVLMLAGHETRQSWSVVSEQGGEIAFDLPSGEHEIDLRVEGFAPVRRRIEVPEAGPHDLGPIRLESGLTLSGEVVTATGRPVPNADVVVRARGRFAARAETADGSGRFAASGLEPGEVELDISAPGHPAFTASATVSADARPVRIELPPIVRLRVVVTGPDGLRRPRLQVSARDESGEWGDSGRTDSAGLVDLLLAPGTWSVEVDRGWVDSVIATVPGIGLDAEDEAHGRRLGVAVR